MIASKYEYVDENVFFFCFLNNTDLAYFLIGEKKNFIVEQVDKDTHSEVGVIIKSHYKRTYDSCVIL